MEKTFNRVFYDEDILRIQNEMRHPEIFDDEEENEDNKSEGTNEIN